MMYPGPLLERPVEVRLRDLEQRIAALEARPTIQWWPCTQPHLTPWTPWNNGGAAGGGGGITYQLVQAT